MHARLRLACDHLCIPVDTYKAAKLTNQGAQEEQLTSELEKIREVLEGAQGLRAEAKERVVTSEEVEKRLLAVEGMTREVGKVSEELKEVRRAEEEKRKAREAEGRKERYSQMLKGTRKKQLDEKMSNQVNSLYQTVNSSLNNFV